MEHAIKPLIDMALSEDIGPGDITTDYLIDEFATGDAVIVAKENLGESAALIAGASLLTDYILTVATSVSSGIAAITSAIPGLAGQQIGKSFSPLVLNAQSQGIRQKILEQFLIPLRN